MAKALLSLIFICTLSFITMNPFGRRSFVNEDCDGWTYCDKGLKCVDYRCQISFSEKPYVPVEWTPKGLKCDWFHYCPTDYTCVKHRCKADKEPTAQAKKQTQKKQQSSKLK